MVNLIRSNSDAGQMKLLTGVHSRSEAMRLFEADCPRQLVTEMGLLAQRRKKEDKKVEQVGKAWQDF